MNRFELTDEEHELLMEVLERRELELQVEILHTDHAEFRKRLKQRLELLHRLKAKFIARIEAMAA